MGQKVCNLWVGNVYWIINAERWSIAVAAVLSNWHNVLRAINMASSKNESTAFTLKLLAEIDSENPEAQGRDRGDGGWGAKEKGKRSPSATDSCPDTYPSSRLIEMITLCVYASRRYPYWSQEQRVFPGAFPGYK